MNATIKIWLAGAILGTALLVGGSPNAAKAQDYWTNYWSWYDGSYVPYYSSRVTYGPSYYSPPYRTYYSAPYRSYYSAPVSTYYGPSYVPYGTYYGAPYAGYYESPYSGGAVQVGRLRIGWR